MPSQKLTFRFITTLSEVDAMLVKTVIFLPQEVVDRLPKGRVRVKGTFNGADFSLAVQHLKDGSRFFSVSAPLRKAAKIRAGDKVAVFFKIIDPDTLEIPEELEAVLAQDDESRRAWEKLTTGYQRSLIHYITSVKNVDSRIRRSLELLQKARLGLLHGQRKKDKN